MGKVVNFLRGDRSALRKAETALEAALKREQDLNGTCRRKISEQVHQFKMPLNAMLYSTRIFVNKAYGELGDPRYTDEAETVHRTVLHLLQTCDAENALSSEGEAEKLLPENMEQVCLTSAPMGQIREIAFCEKILNVSITHSKPCVEPNNMALACRFERIFQARTNFDNFFSILIKIKASRPTLCLSRGET